MKNRPTDAYYMEKALRLAQKAAQCGEVPVGAIVVQQGKIVGRGYNQVERKQDAGRHAEMIALRQAAQRLGQWRLQECELYVTLEPCAMCAGAMVWSRIKRVIFGAKDPKAGACGSVLKVIPHPRLNHRPEVTRDVLAAECRGILQAFFKQLRQAKKTVQ